MRIYGDTYELMSEVLRDLDEMGTIVKPQSMQNKMIKGNPEYYTKEIQNYVYSITNLDNDFPLFLFEDTKDWAIREFAERVQASYKNPGKAWSLRRETWEEFLVDGKFDYAYNERLNHEHNLVAIMEELMYNPDTRQAWLPIFFPEDIQYFGGKKRIPCSLGYYFMVREGTLSLTYIQRSADAVAHFGNDVFLAWNMLTYMAGNLSYKVGMLTHHIFSLHSYQKDWKKLNDGIYTLKTHD